MTPEQEKNFWASLYRIWDEIPVNGDWKRIAHYYKRGSEGHFNVWTNQTFWLVGFDLTVNADGSCNCNYHVAKFYSEAEALAYADRVSE